MTDDELKYFVRGYVYERERDAEAECADAGHPEEERWHHGRYHGTVIPTEAAEGTAISTFVGKGHDDDPDVSAKAAAGTTTTTSSRTKTQGQLLYGEKGIVSRVGPDGWEKMKKQKQWYIQYRKQWSSLSSW